MVEFLYGKSPIQEALAARQRVFHQIYFLKREKPDPGLESALQTARQRKIPVKFVSRQWLDEKFAPAQTQGWVARVSEYAYFPLEELLRSLRDQTQALILALDQVQDPQNLGAILRSAEACGVNGVVVPEKRASPVTPAVCKASAGAAEHLKICRVPNLVRAMTLLKKEGFWAVGTRVEEAEDALDFQWPEKTLLVLGSEGKGMRRLVQDSCDFLIHLPQTGKIASLNVSATAAVCLYLWLRSRRP